jgi:hypothetical protein
MSFKLKHIFLLLLLGVFLFGLFKLAMYWRVKTVMDDLVEEAGPHAEITYGGISTDLSGAATVENIRVQPRDVAGEVEVARVRFSTGDPIALAMGWDWRSAERPPPEQMSLAVQGMRVALDEQMLESLQLQAGGQLMPGPGGGDGCQGAGFNLDARILKDLGFEFLEMDLNFAYQFDRLAETLEASVGFDLHDIESGEMSMELAGILPEDVSAQRTTLPALAKADLQVVVAREFGDRYMKLCAERAGLTADAYRERLLDEMQAGFAQVGVELGQGLMLAMQELYRDWGELRIRVLPEKPLGMLQLMTLSPDTLVSTLGLSLYVNDRLIPDLGFRFDPQLLQQGLGGAPGAQQESGEAPPQRVRITRRYRTIPVASLDRYLGSEVRIKPLDQPVRSGTLAAIVDGEVLVEQRSYGGKLTSYVPIEEIESAEVQEIVRTPLR